MNTVHIKIDTCCTFFNTYTMNQAHVTSGWWNPHVTHGSRWPVVAPAIGPWDPGSLVRSNRRILEIYANWYIHVYRLICIYIYVYICVYIYMYIVFISMILVYRTFVWWLRAMFSSKKGEHAACTCTIHPRAQVRSSPPHRLGLLKTHGKINGSMDTLW